MDVETLLTFLVSLTLLLSAADCLVAGRLNCRLVVRASDGVCLLHKKLITVFALYIKPLVTKFGAVYFLAKVKAFIRHVAKTRSAHLRNAVLELGVHRVYDYAIFC